MNINLRQAPKEAPASTKAVNSVGVWLVLATFMFIVKTILDIFLPQAFADPAQAAQFSWVNLSIYTLVGLIGVLLSQKTGFPDAWQAGQSLWHRLIFPTLIGSGLGVLMVLIDLPTGFTKMIAANHGTTQQYTDFPSMLLIFTAAPIIVETAYRLFIIPLLLWVISNVILKGNAQTPIFWMLAVLTSLLEPLGQSTDLLVLPGILAASLGTIYFGINMIQAGFFRKYGFLAAIMVRVGFYFVWHVLYVH
jgi:hypothetical protein